MLNNHRLTKNIYPINYKLELEPNLRNFTFSGKVKISIDICESTNKMALHSKNLKIKTASIQKNSTDIFEYPLITEDVENEIIILEFEYIREPGKYLLS